MENKTTLRNPTPEELRALQNKDAVKIIKEDPKKETKQDINAEVANISPDEEERELKVQTFANLEIIPPKSSFEPAPVSFKLPSSNLIVKSGEIMVRRMTTIEESLFQETIAQSVQQGTFSIDSFLETINRSLATCIKSKINIYRLSLIDKISLFLFVIAKSYGENYDVGFDCTYCGQDTKHKINILNDLITKYVPMDYVYPHPIPLNSFKNELTLYGVFPRIQDEKLFFSKGSIMLQLESVTYKIEGRTNDGDLVEPKHYKDILSNLNKEDKNRIKEFIADFGTFGTGLDIKFEEGCHNNDCSEYKNPQSMTLPLEELIYQIFI